MNKPFDRIEAAKHILASIFSSQEALQQLAPEYRWTGLGNLLGDFGELFAIDAYGLKKAVAGAPDYDAMTKDGHKVQIKANYSSKEIGFRGEPDMLLVLRFSGDGEWRELYFGPFAPVKAEARHSGRDNKHMMSVSKLKGIQKAQQAA